MRVHTIAGSPTSCTQSPQRRIGIAVVPITAGVDESVAEIEAAAGLGLKGIMIPTRWFDQQAYHHPMYDPVWAACAANGLPVHTHSGAGPADYDLGPGFVSIYANEAWWWAARPLWVLVLSGVFERHPALRYSIAENGAWWVPDLTKRMDEKWVGAHNTRKFGDVFKQELSMKPSEYLDRNVALAASTPGVDEIERRHEIGVGNLLWGNDLPAPGRHVPAHAAMDQRALRRGARGRSPSHPRRQRDRVLRARPWRADGHRRSHRADAGRGPPTLDRAVAGVR